MPEILEATKSPVIIHFTGPNKPWFAGSKHPYCKRFLYYKNLSLWKSHTANRNKTSLYDCIIKLRNEVIWLFGIKKRPITYIIKMQD